MVQDEHTGTAVSGDSGRLQSPESCPHTEVYSDVIHKRPSYRVLRGVAELTSTYPGILGEGSS